MQQRWWAARAGGLLYYLQSLLLSRHHPAQCTIQPHLCAHRPLTEAVKGLAGISAASTEALLRTIWTRQQTWWGCVVCTLSVQYSLESGLVKPTRCVPHHSTSQKQTHSGHFFQKQMFHSEVSNILLQLCLYYSVESGPLCLYISINVCSPNDGNPINQ